LPETVPGLVAMLLMAVCPALVTCGSIVIADTFATFFVLVVPYFCTRIQMETSKTIWRDVALAGVATGLAFASKYRAATVGIAVVTTSLIVPVRCARAVFNYFF
jgi:dolichyl-phosphate-mannose--protein O-mannosyl transferase